MLTKVDDRIWIIDTMALERPEVVAAYIIQGKESALIDMGYASSFQSVLKDIEESGIGSEGIDYLLPTHVHLDHAGACGSLAESFPRASIRVHPKGAPHLGDPAKLCEAAGKLFGPELMKRYGSPQAINESRVKAIGDGEAISLGNSLTLRSVWTPGHASHHLSYVLEGTGTVFTGDAIGITYPSFPALIPTTPPTSFNLEAAIESLQRIREVTPKQLLTPHYGIIHDAIASIDQNTRSLREWTTKIEAMRRNGLCADAIAANLSKEIGLLSGHNAGTLPDYAQMSITISVLGAIQYLNFSDKPPNA
jgi:glyoxylase-like metal-dependent hydrolase (beta-lactamase superfamily II)